VSRLDTSRTACFKAASLPRPRLTELTTITVLVRCNRIESITPAGLIVFATTLLLWSLVARSITIWRLWRVAFGRGIACAFAALR